MSRDRPTGGHSSLHKTKWCEFYARSHGCRHGDDCRHAHFWHEYRGTHAADGGHIGDVRRHDRSQEAAGSDSHIQLVNEFHQHTDDMRRRSALLDIRLTSLSLIVEEVTTVEEEEKEEEVTACKEEDDDEEAGGGEEEQEVTAVKDEYEDDEDRALLEAASPMCRLLVGHTHDEIDRLFSRIKVALTGHDDPGGHKADPGDEAADDPHDPDEAQEQVQDDRSTDGDHFLTGDEGPDDPDGAQDDGATRLRWTRWTRGWRWGYSVKMDKLQGYFSGAHGFSIKYLDQRAGCPSEHRSLK